MRQESQAQIRPNRAQAQPLAASTLKPGGRDAGKAGRATGAGMLAMGGMIGAILASSCCILPLLLVMLGLGGAWTANLTVLDPYRVYFLVATSALLAGGFWQVYFKPRQVCPEEGSCTSPISGTIMMLALWTATALVAFAATIDYWAPLLY